MSEHSPCPWYESYPEEVPHRIDGCPFPSIGAMFDEVTREFAERTAFISLETRLSYKALARKVRDLAAFLQNELGASRGDNLAVILPNTLQYPITIFAALKLGLRVVNVNPLYTERELQDVLVDCRARYVVALDTNAAVLERIWSEIPADYIILTSVGDELGVIKGALVNYAVNFKNLVAPYNPEHFIFFNHALKRGARCGFTPDEITPEDTAFLQYTGGTTGKPKGAMLTHGNILSNVAQAYAMYGPVLRRGAETILTALPLYHIFAMTVNLMFAFYIGSTGVLIVDPRDFKTLVRAMRKHQEISIITGVNTLFNAMLNKNVFRQVRLKNLRLVVGGGAAVQQGVAERFLETTGIPILEGYGLTECSPLCCVNPYTSKAYNGTIGLPVPSTLARIVDPGTGEEIRGTGRSGELEFKGPQVMRGYYRQEKETEHVFDDGWLRTGDIAVWEQGGYIRIIDRLKDMILVSGFNVFPSEIEDVVSLNPKVAECAVIGVPSKSSGETVKIFIVKKDPYLTANEIIEFCKSRLTGYKVPKYVEFVGSLPKSAVGKVLRRHLRA